jgi:single-strand DNA-binding protein
MTMSEKSINKVILVGRVGKEPKSATMPNGTAVCNFSMATGKSWKDQSGERKESTEWHRCTAFGKLAEIATSYVRAGMRLYIEGEIRTRSYKDDNGQDKYITEIIANDLVMLSGGDGATHSQAAQPQPAPQQGDQFDDNIPF